MISVRRSAGMTLACRLGMAVLLAPSVLQAAPRTMTMVGGYRKFEKAEQPIAGTDSPDRFRYEVWGNPVTVTAGDLPAGTYCVEIDFAEFVHWARNKRVMSISCGTEVLVRDLDIFVAAGGANRAYTLTSEVRHPGGAFRLKFTSSKDNAKFGAIRVLNANGGLVAVVEACKVPLPPQPKK